MKNPAASGMPMIGDVEREDVDDDVAEDELFILERVNGNCFDISMLFFFMKDGHQVCVTISRKYLQRF